MRPVMGAPDDTPQIHGLMDEIERLQADAAKSLQLVRLDSQEAVRKHIQECESRHVQQAVYSTFHDALTQVCYGCRVVRTSLGGR